MSGARPPERAVRALRPRQHGTSSTRVPSLTRLVADHLATSWVGGVYEPETDAFGGPEAMDIAHQVFCADSRSALAESGSPGARECCVLLISALNCAAGLDPFEVDDVWAKVASLRSAIEPPTGIRRAAAITAMRRLMNADAAQRDITEPGGLITQHEPTADLPTPHDSRLRAAVVDVASSDAYAARDVLGHRVMRCQMTYQQVHELAAVLTASGFGARNLPAVHMDALTAAVDTAEDHLRTLLVTTPPRGDP